MNTWLLTPAPAGRLEDVLELHGMCGIPAERRVVVTTLPDPIEPGLVDAEVLLFGSTEFNIGKWWTLGLDWIQDTADAPYEVLLAESDARIHADDVGMLAWTLRDEGLTAVGPDWFGTLTPGELLVSEVNLPAPVHHRLPGTATMVAGELGVRHDPQFRWWYADDDFLFQHRLVGSVALVGGTSLVHAGGTPLVGELSQWANEDAVKFRDKWGCLPL